MLKLEAGKRFEKDLRKLPSPVIEALEVVVSNLRRNPILMHTKVKKLKGFKEQIWRIRIGDYRLIYQFTSTTLILLRIRHRKDIYKNL